ncbi:MAG: mechanosensitive ion channel [Balneolaceae bacterium]|nr:mechanosensitive ion channel [Balneolaceae bacterium]
MEQIDQIQETLIPLLVDHGLSVLGALVVLIAGWIISRWASKRVEGFSSRSERIDKTLTPIFVKGVRIIVMTITVLIVLGQFGVETASLLALLGTIGLAIGLALQGTLSNIASGMMLLILRPFNVGDVVDIAGTMGIVDEIGLFVTEMHSFDNIAITMPNSKIWGGKIENYTQNSTRRVDLEFGISYDDDINKAMDIIKDVLNNDERVLAEPETLIAVGTLADSSVNIRVRPWTQTENVWPLRYDLIKRIKERFDEEDITIPYPQRDIHMFNEGTE